MLTTIPDTSSSDEGAFYTRELVSMSRRLPRRQDWEVRASTLARNTHNLIRGIVENLQVEPNPEKPLIALSVGKYIYFYAC